jgi:hypothetical protein
VCLLSRPIVTLLKVDIIYVLIREGTNLKDEEEVEVKELVLIKE